MTLSVSLCDDQPDLAIWLRTVLEAERDSAVIREIGNGRDVVRETVTHQPDAGITIDREPSTATNGPKTLNSIKIPACGAPAALVIHEINPPHNRRSGPISPMIIRGVHARI